MKNIKIEYWIYDSRYWSNPDRAVVFEVCSSLKEAKRNSDDYGDNNAIVKKTIENNMVVESVIIN